MSVAARKIPSADVILVLVCCVLSWIGRRAVNLQKANFLTHRPLNSQERTPVLAEDETG